MSSTARINSINRDASFARTPSVYSRDGKATLRQQSPGRQQQSGRQQLSVCQQQQQEHQQQQREE
jgi:hypothetical protein